jgi:hypothetical protein
MHLVFWAPYPWLTPEKKTPHDFAVFYVHAI